MFCDYYLPGYKSGGGMRTIVNMVDRLHPKYDFCIVTRDHDGKLDKEQYKNVKINQWNFVRNAQVYYLSKDNIKISKLRELILDVKPDSIYANSFFATLSIIAVKLRKLKLIPNKNIVIAPCGELSDGSLELKSAKKRIFINLSKISGLYKDIIWKASSELEKEEISKIKGKGGKIFISPDLPPRFLSENYSQNKKPKKKVGNAKMIFLSRFMRKKNFFWLLENLKNIKGQLIIDIYGPLEDKEYWEECCKKIKNLPENIMIESKGSIPYEKTAQLLFEYQFFILPTLAENFGHVFLEALAAGCPLVISDRTPWLDLENKGIGWDLSLEKPKDWIDKINHCISMNNEEYSKTSSNARRFAVDWFSDENVEMETVKVLDYSLSKSKEMSV
jgi:glycosyltransferase involved in cell wall biosynthesis